MRKKHRPGHKKRFPPLVVAFGSLLGLVAVGYGAVMLVLRPAGIGPCRVNCGLEQAFLTILGQPLYNLLFGLLWVSVGLALIVFLLTAQLRR